MVAGLIDKTHMTVGTQVAVLVWRYATYGLIPERSPHVCGRAQKKALIRYHPDRHHAAGMAAQVEAEELFKIVSEAPATRVAVGAPAKYPATRHPFPPRRR